MLDWVGDLFSDGVDYEEDGENSGFIGGIYDYVGDLFGGTVDVVGNVVGGTIDIGTGLVVDGEDGEDGEDNDNA